MLNGQKNKNLQTSNFFYTNLVFTVFVFLNEEAYSEKMPKIDASSDTLVQRINEIVGASMSEEQLRELEYNGAEATYYSEVFEKILFNMYMMMINVVDLQNIFRVETKLDAAISLYMINDELAHVFSVEYLKEFLFKVEKVCVEERKMYVRQVTRNRTLSTFNGATNSSEPCSLNKTKLTPAVSKLLVRLHCLADLAAYNYSYYMQYKTFFEIGTPYKKISKKLFLFDLLSTSPNPSIANYVQGKKHKKLDCFTINEYATTQDLSSAEDTTTSDSSSSEDSY